MNKGQQMRFSDDELKLVKSAFKGNTELLKLMRKVFLPEFDPDAPIGQTIDLWMTINIEKMTTEEAMIHLHARNSLILHIETMISQLSAMAEVPEGETPKELEERLKKDSLK